MAMAAASAGTPVSVGAAAFVNHDEVAVAARSLLSQGAISLAEYREILAAHGLYRQEQQDRRCASKEQTTTGAASVRGKKKKKKKQQQQQQAMQKNKNKKKNKKKYGRFGRRCCWMCTGGACAAMATAEAEGVDAGAGPTDAAAAAAVLRRSARLRRTSRTRPRQSAAAAAAVRGAANHARRRSSRGSRRGLEDVVVGGVEKEALPYSAPVDPITLEPITDPKRAFVLAQSTYDALSLIQYLACTGDLRDPISRAPLSLAQLRILDGIAAELHKEQASVAGHNDRVTKSSSASENREEKKEEEEEEEEEGRKPGGQGAKAVCLEKLWLESRRQDVTRQQQDVQCLETIMGDAAMEILHVVERTIPESDSDDDSSANRNRSTAGAADAGALFPRTTRPRDQADMLQHFSIFEMAAAQMKVFDLEGARHHIRHAEALLRGPPLSPTLGDQELLQQAVKLISELWTPENDRALRRQHNDGASHRSAGIAVLLLPPHHSSTGSNRSDGGAELPQPPTHSHVPPAVDANDSAESEAEAEERKEDEEEEEEEEDDDNADLE